MSKNEEKTVVWFDDRGYGRLCKNEEKGEEQNFIITTVVSYFFLTFFGQRLAISALLSLDGFHLCSLDTFKCGKVHSMDSAHFVTWMDSAASTLRSEHGENN